MSKLITLQFYLPQVFTVLLPFQVMSIPTTEPLKIQLYSVNVIQ